VDFPVDAGSAGDGRSVERLHRSANDRVVAGVCGGIAEYLSVDPRLVRIAFVIGTLWGIGLLVYIVLALILPVQDYPPVPTGFSPQRSHVVVGTLLVVLGGLLLAGNVGWAPWLTWNLFWPALLILTGVALLMRQPRRHTFS
jgi:phage shock protein C